MSEWREGPDLGYLFEKVVQSEDDERSAYLDGKSSRRAGKTLSDNNYKADNLRWAFNAGYNYEHYTECEKGFGI